jgi:hypothetical protein
MRKGHVFLLGASLNLLFNVTAGLIDRPLAIRITRWGWLYFLVHLSYLLLSGKQAKERAVRLRSVFGRFKVTSYVVVCAAAALLGLIYWLGINAAYSHLLRGTRPGMPGIAEKPPTLNDLFKSESANTMKFADEDRIGIQGKNRTVLRIKTQVYADFQAKTQFVGFYIPASPKTYEACLLLVDAVLSTIQNLPKQLAVSAGYRDQQNSLQDLTFSGRVLLYHEDHLSIPQKAAIMNAYTAARFDVQFRGPDYLGDQVIAWHRQHDLKGTH